MSKRTNRNTLLTMSVFLLAIVSTTFAGPLLCPLHVGLRCEYNRWDSNDPVNEWQVLWEVKSQVTIDSLDYFQLQEWNYDNNSTFEDWYLRSTEDAVYGYNPDGDDYMEFQKAPVGTKWSFYQEHDSGFNYKVIEIVAIEPVTVPYGTFCMAYVHRRYRCVDPDNLSLGKSPDWYEWMVPGIGYVKQVDYWAKEELGQIPPLTMELVDVIIAADIEADIDIRPDKLNLQSNAKWITCYIWLPEGYDVADTKSIILNGEVTPGWYMVHETRQMLTVKFKRSKVQDMLNVGQVELTISGELIDGIKFEGTDTITVTDKGNKD